ncbi:helix-hairpin-helix domain-containing protein [Butyrivibrio sp. AD3002]|uniref:helix-hairpin-helix domain-containing protein n=1 Tax=Butyrivibrio sp. AD3002 TaxID=1280670 RepID=UPI0003B37795|nr:helix-hairpin-helix domain-containing protein [Butyrivibrio sp. AD3002]
MHKNITKSFIISILTGMLILSGCSRKNAELVLTEPDRTSETVSVQDDRPVSDASGSESAETQNSSSADSVSSAEADTASDTTVKEEKSNLPETIMVHVCGAVLCEGVYELPGGSRVVDAVKAAGGFSEEADSDYINQALVLSDGVKVKIPTLEETAISAQNGNVQTDISVEPGSDTAGVTGMNEDSSSSSESEGGKVNINTADETQLCTIPGIGPGRAKNILAYREENGKFGTIDDIKKVSGIKDKFFAKIKDYITV